MQKKHRRLRELLGLCICLPFSASATTEINHALPSIYPGFADVVRVEPITTLATERTPVKRCTWEQLPDRVEYDRYRQERRVTERRARRCHTVYESKSVRKVSGYNVTLRYNGEIFSRQMSTPPGPRLPVSVEVSAY